MDCITYLLTLNVSFCRSVGLSDLFPLLNMLGVNTTLSAAFTITFKNFFSAYLMPQLVHGILDLVMELGSILIKIILYELLNLHYLTDFGLCLSYNVFEFI